MAEKKAKKGSGAPRSIHHVVHKCSRCGCAHNVGAVCLSCGCACQGRASCPCCGAKDE